MTPWSTVLFLLQASVSELRRGSKLTPHPCPDFPLRALHPRFPNGQGQTSCHRPAGLFGFLPGQRRGLSAGAKGQLWAPGTLSSKGTWLTGCVMPKMRKKKSITDSAWCPRTSRRLQLMNKTRGKKNRNTGNRVPGSWAALSK